VSRAKEERRSIEHNLVLSHENVKRCDTPFRNNLHRAKNKQLLAMEYLIKAFHDFLQLLNEITRTVPEDGPPLIPSIYFGIYYSLSILLFSAMQVGKRCILLDVEKNGSAAVN
jgi:hypothetical protein